MPLTIDDEQRRIILNRLLDYCKDNPGFVSHFIIRDERSSSRAPKIVEVKSDTSLEQLLGLSNTSSGLPFNELVIYEGAPRADKRKATISLDSGTGRFNVAPSTGLDSKVQALFENLQATLGISHTSEAAIAPRVIRPIAGRAELPPYSYIPQAASLAGEPHHAPPGAGGAGAVSMSSRLISVPDPKVIIGAVHADPDAGLLARTDEHCVKTGGIRDVGYCEDIGSERATQEDALFYHPMDYSGLSTEEVAACLKTAISDTDKAIPHSLVTEAGRKPEFLKKQGSTLSMTTVNKNIVTTATLGDAAAFAIIYDRKGKAIGCKRLNSRIHKPTDADESKRITDAGGLVLLGRVDGKLAVSRALGDAGYTGTTGVKLVIADPQIDTYIIPEDAYRVQIVNVCDGFTDAADEDNQTIVGHQAIMLEALHRCNGGKPGLLSEVELAKYLTRFAKEKGSTDNISVLVQTVKDKGKAATKHTVQGICDGHGGSVVSTIAANSLGGNFQKQLYLARERKEAATMSAGKVRAVGAAVGEEASPATAVCSTQVFKGAVGSLKHDADFSNEAFRELSVMIRKNDLWSKEHTALPGYYDHSKIIDNAYDAISKSEEKGLPLSYEETMLVSYVVTHFDLHKAQMDLIKAGGRNFADTVPIEMKWDKLMKIAPKPANLTNDSFKELSAMVMRNILTPLYYNDKKIVEKAYEAVIKSEGVVLSVEDIDLISYVTEHYDLHKAQMDLIKAGGRDFADPVPIETKWDKLMEMVSKPATPTI